MNAYGKTSAFRVIEETPFNGGTPLNDEAMLESALTPNDLFFVRNHGDVPEVDPETYRLQIDGLVERPLSLSLADLRELPRRTETAVMQCAGNRRVELTAHQPIFNELMWDIDGVGCARWSGWSLADVLALAGVLPSARHAAFEGLDQCAKDGITFPYGSSIPLTKVSAAETLLADQMNDQPLPPAHGFPLRVVVPGYIGARSVKWLSRITLQADPSDNYYQQVAYTTPEGHMIGEYPVNALIQTPADGEVIPAGNADRVDFRGFALVGGGRGIARVEYRVDQGDWMRAELSPSDSPWSWHRWTAVLPSLERGEHVLQVRAVDTAGNHQPAAIEDVWSPKGYLNNAWHTVRVMVR